MDNKQIHLLSKKRSGLRQLLFGRITVVLLLLIGKILLMLALFLRFEAYILHYFGGTTVLAIVMVLYLQNRRMDPSFRNSWTVIIMATPILGTLLYVFFELEIGHKLLKKRVSWIKELPDQQLMQEPKTVDALRQYNPGGASLYRFASKSCQAVVYTDTEVEYLPLGEIMLERLLQELELAKKFIYLEYFIVSEGEMWGRILNVLSRKAAEGVDVRLIYDGTCEFVLLPKNYPAMLAKLGIQCKVFAPMTPLLSTHYNYRDHRKILVIDGHTAFNGGINLSDEYVNLSNKFGHWKDTALMLKGSAVIGFTRMFLHMWNLDCREPDFSALKQFPEPAKGQGYVMPFCDDPLDAFETGQTIYIDMINRAITSVDIMTPYLIIGDRMENALRFAAQRGVRVRLLLPGIADKYIPYAMAKTHYKPLTEAGVEIYEYSPGFVHGKIVTIDDSEAVVGTVNFDYRSFCHHFECGTWICGVPAIAAIREDYDECIRRSRRVTAEAISREKWHIKLTGFLLRGTEPLL